MTLVYNYVKNDRKIVKGNNPIYGLTTSKFFLIKHNVADYKYPRNLRAWNSVATTISCVFSINI